MDNKTLETEVLAEIDAFAAKHDLHDENSVMTRNSVPGIIAESVDSDDLRRRLGDLFAVLAHRHGVGHVINVDALTTDLQ